MCRATADTTSGTGTLPKLDNDTLGESGLGMVEEVDSDILLVESNWGGGSR